jgi:hypothetical protein
MRPLTAIASSGWVSAGVSLLAAAVWIAVVLRHADSSAALTLAGIVQGVNLWLVVEQVRSVIRPRDDAGEQRGGPRFSGVFLLAPLMVGGLAHMLVALALAVGVAGLLYTLTRREESG